MESMTLSTNGVCGNAQDKKKISIKYLFASVFDEIVMGHCLFNSPMPLDCA
jgi:hypothetical protein